VSMMLVRGIARAVGSNSGLTIQLRHDQGGQVLISISNSAVGPAAGEQTKNLHGQRENVIFSCVSWQPPGDTYIGQDEGDEVLSDALVFDQ
jgi:hypothetical protein